MFTPNFGENEPKLTDIFFQMDWFNHQPENNLDAFFFGSVDESNRTLKCPITTNPFVLVKRIGTAPRLRETGANMLKHVLVFGEVTGR